MSNWNKLLIPPHYLGAACNKDNAGSWPPSRERSDRSFTDKEKKELDSKGIRIKNESRYAILGEGRCELNDIDLTHAMDSVINARE